MQSTQTHDWIDQVFDDLEGRAVLKLTNLYEHGVFGEDEEVHRELG